jgi:Ca2+-binding EF-hand superfamily protein
MTSPSKLKQSYTASEDNDDEFDVKPLNIRSKTEPPQPSKPESSAFSISAAARSPARFNNTQSAQADNLSKLPPQLLHSMRESFSVLDSNSTGSINAASVVETLQSLGLQEQNTSQFFPPGRPQQLSLPQYLNQLANILVNLSPQQELLNAFAAFDDDDSGQVDVAELRDALLNTAPDTGERALSDKHVDNALEGFTGRRILGRHAVGIAGVRGLNEPANKKNGEVFRYQEFIANLMGGGADPTQRVPAR